MHTATRIALTFICALASAHALAAPAQLRVSIVDDPRTTMGIAWTTEAVEASVVQYGPTTAYGDEVSGASPQLVDGVGYVHEVVLSGLQPGTSYHYRVGDGVTWSEDASFTTSPDDPCGPWRFVAMGDDRSQWGTGDHPGVADGFPDILLEAVAHDPALIINSGDLVEDGHIAAQWVDYLSATELVARQVPMLGAIGNHDDDSVDGDGAKYNGVFMLPRNPETNTEDFYVVRYRNAVIAVLSTATFKGGSATDSRAFAMQGEWLDQVLTEHADATWKIVALHHPPFTGGGFTILGYGIGHEANEADTNAVLLPIIDRHHVDFVISGHNHWYERFFPLVEGSALDVGEVAPSPDDGTIYITTGGAGAYTMEFDWIPILDVCDGDVEGTRAECSGTHHYVVFSIEDRDLSLETWSTRCQNVGCDHEPELIDSLSFTKGGASTCAPLPDAGAALDASRPDVEAVDAPALDAAGADHVVVTDAAGPDRALFADAGTDAARADLGLVAADASIRSQPDATDAPSPAVGGCGCGAGPGPGGRASLVGLIGAALWARRRRAR